jgi:hypothetical protein
MKRLITALLILSSSVAFAQHRGHHHHHNYHNHHRHSDARWIAPLIIGTIIGHAVSNNSVQAAPIGMIPTPIAVIPPSATADCLNQYGVTCSHVQCPYPTQHYFETTYYQNQFGQMIPITRLAGCR